MAKKNVFEMLYMHFCLQGIVLEQFAAQDEKHSLVVVQVHIQKFFFYIKN